MDIEDLDKLFSSRTRVRLLLNFFRQEDKAFYQAELQENSPISVVQYELKKLVKIGIIQDYPSKNKIHYFLAKRHCLYPGLKAIFSKARKNAGK